MIRRPLAALLFLPLLCATPKAEPMRVMTWNLRYDNPADGPSAWPKRQEAVAGAIRYHHPDILCTQEGLSHMVAFLQKELGMAMTGVGRNDGKAAGEFAAIFYAPTRFRKLEEGHFWLNTTPDRPGLGWDAASIRIATWVKLMDRQGRPVLVLNTHLDDQGQMARREGARLIQTRLKTLAQGMPVLVTGDFNAGPADDACRVMKEAGLVDSHEASATRHHGPWRTFWGFDPAHPLADERIDFIFASPAIRILTHATPADLTEAGRLLSDHLPVVTDVVLPKGTSPTR